MNQALIQDAQHDIDHHQCGQYQQWLLVLRLLGIARRARKTAAHVVGQADFRFRLLHRRLPIIERAAFGEIERHGGREFAVFMADRRSFRVFAELCNRRQRHHGRWRRTEHLPGRRVTQGRIHRYRRAAAVGRTA